MNDFPVRRMAVVGIGNLIRTDDGLGIHALNRLRNDRRLPRSVTLLDGGTCGLELLAYISDTTHLLLLDALDVGEPPGTLIRMQNEELHGLPCAASVHQVGLADLLATLPLVSTLRRETVLLGIQPADTGWGTSLSPKVEESLARLVEAAEEQLELWRQAESANFSASSALGDESFGESRSKGHAEGGAS